jgi:PAS domain S-box-containing protein
MKDKIKIWTGSINYFNASLISSAYLLFVWIILLAGSEMEFSLASIFELHRNNALLIFVDLIPIISFAVFFTLNSKLSRTTASYKKEIEKITSINSMHASQAKKLGTGDYSSSIETEGPDDRMGNALIVLQTYLRYNQKKEKNLAWINEGRDNISRILRNHTDISQLSYEIIKDLISYISAAQGALYIYKGREKTLVNVATYAYNRKRFINQEFKIGQGLVGQCAYEMDVIYRTEIPADYATITTGILGDAKPAAILLIPLISDETLRGVMEFAFITEKVPKLTIMYLLELGEIIGRTFYNLQLSHQTELLLEESRKMTEELRLNEMKLKENAEEMEKTQSELKRSNEQLEAKIREVQNAQGKIHWLLENSSEVISIYSEAFQLSFVSPSVTRILGYTPEEMMQGKDIERMSTESASHFRELLEQSVNSGESNAVAQYSFIKKDGQKIYLESSARNYLHDPAIQGIIVNSRDITEKIRAEKEERLKTRMQSLSENSLDVIIRLSTTGHFHYANPVVEDYTGLGPKNLLNKALSEISLPASMKNYLMDALLKMNESPKKLNNEIPIPIKLGEKLSERIVSFDAIPEFAADQLETVLFVGHDITEAKRIGKEIQVKNKNIEDSINYARKIQRALLPDLDQYARIFPRSFMFYKPRDVVSGDFPWLYSKNGHVYLAAIDCTGHGVPGALLSFIAYFILNNIIEQDDDCTAAQILDKLHNNVRSTLKQDSDRSDARDGMDIAFCKIDFKKSELQYAGAHRPLLILSEGELTEIKGDRKAIGGILPGKKAEEDFTNNSIPYRKGDKFFIFTDGLPDQLGGPYGRKYSTKRIRDFILENPGYTMKQYNELFTNDFADWQKGFKQLDDLLMMGIEF